MARVWFYRDLNPNEPMATPYVRIDGAIAAGGTILATNHAIAIDATSMIDAAECLSSCGCQCPRPARSQMRTNVR